MRQRYALDASVLASIVNSDDPEHFSCYSFFRNLHDEDKALWVVPGLIFFEFQATQSRRYRERRPGKPVFRDAPLFYTNTELYHVTKKFLIKVSALDLLRHTFAIRRLRGGANLVAVSGLLRHSSTRMSERYLHVTRTDLRAAVEAGSGDGLHPSQPSPTGTPTGTEVEALLQEVDSEEATR